MKGHCQHENPPNLFDLKNGKMVFISLVILVLVFTGLISLLFLHFAKY